MIRFEALDATHDRVAFTCGEPSLDRFLHELAHQAMRKYLSATFVAVESKSPAQILGYYTLSSHIVGGTELPSELRKRARLPQHTVSATLLGRLGVSTSRQGTGLGAMLLLDALRRAYFAAREVGSTCLLVDALDERAASFYAHFGFVRLESTARLVLMMDSIGMLIGSQRT